MSLFTESDLEQLVQAISSAEKETSGEIRIHLEAHCGDSPMNRAKEVFALLNMHETHERNGILIYLAHEDKKFALWGDQGIHDHVGQDFWEKLANMMVEYFSQSQYLQGLLAVVQSLGKELSVYFPYQSNDRNELDNEISIG